MEQTTSNLFLRQQEQLQDKTPEEGSASLFPEDEGTLEDLHLLFEPGIGDQANSRKRPQGPSTDSSGGPELEHWPAILQNPTPFLDEKGLVTFSDITQISSVEREEEPKETWRTQKKKKKKGKD